MKTKTQIFAFLILGTWSLLVFTTSCKKNNDDEIHRNPGMMGEGYSVRLVKD